MIQFPNLLQTHSTFSVFWKTILERLTIADAPFFSRICDNYLMIDADRCSLNSSPRDVVEFCSHKWTIPEPVKSWRGIKKESVKNLMLQEYLERQNLSPNEILKIQQSLVDKTFSCEDIVLEDGRIVKIRGI